MWGGAPDSYLTEKAVIRGSDIQGKGAFAVAPIRRHEMVALLNGVPMTLAEALSLPEEIRDYPIQVWFDLFLGPRAVDQIETVDLINHSCDPNCGIVGCTVIVARRDIAPGEELTFDYGTACDEDWNMVCRCGAPDCRGLITGADWRDPRFRERHAGYLSQFIDLLVAREAGTPAVAPSQATAAATAGA